MKRKLRSLLEQVLEAGFAAVGMVFISVVVALMVLGAWHLMGLWFRPADGALPAEDPAEGVGMRTETVGAVIALTGADWFAPEEAETVWEEPVRDIASPDWNLNTSLVGWDGRKMEVWELDLLSMIFYKEFWGTSLPCCEAGCDAILNLWSSGLYGATMGEVLSATNDNGYYMFSTYPTVWETVYDPDGLAWCREFCLGRFLSGPTWVDAMYFRLWGYHDTSWSIPLYEIDGVYFSMGRKW